VCVCKWPRPAAGAVSSGSPAPRAPAAPPHSDWASKHSLSSSFSQTISSSLSLTHGLSDKDSHSSLKEGFYSPRTTGAQADERLLFDRLHVNTTNGCVQPAQLRHFRYLNLPRDSLDMHAAPQFAYLYYALQVCSLLFLWRKSIYFWVCSKKSRQTLGHTIHVIFNGQLCRVHLLLLWFLLAVCKLCALPPSTGMGNHIGRKNKQQTNKKKNWELEPKLQLALCV